MGVEPVQTLLALEYSDAPGQRDCRCLLSQGQVRMEVDLYHLRLAGDAVDGRPWRPGRPRWAATEANSQRDHQPNSQDSGAASRIEHSPPDPQLWSAPRLCLLLLSTTRPTHRASRASP